MYYFLTFGLFVETTTNPPVIETTKSSSNITSKKESSQNATSDSVQKSPQDDTDTTLVCDPETHYLCSDGKCIPNEKLCDGKGDCRDRKVRFIMDIFIHIFKLQGNCRSFIMKCSNQLTE